MREKTLEEKRLGMAKVIKVLNAQIEYLDELKAKQAGLSDELNKIYETEEIDIGGIYTYRSFISKLFDEIRKQERIIENTRKILYVKQLEVNEALKKVKILEKLKEKEEKKFNDHINYVQAKEIDDIATTRYKAKAS